MVFNTAADLHWAEMIQAVTLQLWRRLSRDYVLKMSISQRSTYLWQNPITGVCMFKHRPFILHTIFIE